MRPLLFKTVICLITLIGLSGVGRAAYKIQVLTSLDVTQTVGEALAEGTSIQVVNVIPKGYSMDGQDAYLKLHRKHFFGVAAKADAVLTVGAAWPGDPLYRWARRANIRVVHIDCAKPLDGYGAGVPLLEVDGDFSPFVWRSPANLTRMASIVADDFCRLAPDDSEIIRANLKRLQTALFQLRTRFEGAFLELDTVDLAAFTRDWTYLVHEFGLDIHFYELTPESRWTDAQTAKLAKRLRGEELKGVICSWEPDAKGREVIRAGNAQPVVMEQFRRKGNTAPVDALIDWYDGNLSRLLNALKN